MAGVHVVKWKSAVMYFGSCDVALGVVGAVGAVGAVDSERVGKRLPYKRQERPRC